MAVKGDSELRAHHEWLGYVQPVGLVVSAPALAAAQAHVNRNVLDEHRRFLEHVAEVPVGEEGARRTAVTDLAALLCDLFGWRAADLAGGPGAEPLPPSLEVALPEYGETLRPTYAVEDPEPADAGRPWQMLVQQVETGAELDRAAHAGGHGWDASPQARFERLLREVQVPIGLLSNGTHLRLVYAPRGESSGHLTFPVQAMSEVAGRPIFAALHLLLGEDRLFTLPRAQRLPAILELSRKYQNDVSNALSGQVLSALYELLRGFQAADDLRRGQLLGPVLGAEPNHVYAGLLTVLLRSVFILYAEDRGLLSDDEVYARHYSLTGLFERLREDEGRYPDTMDQRFGAWAQLLALFRLVHDGGRHGAMRIPRRHGYLFDPDRYPFVEGRPRDDHRVMNTRIDPPMVPDGVVLRVLRNLLVLEGERISYRALDVEQIGSVYETMMGFDLRRATGRSIAVRPAKAHGAPVAVDLDALLREKPEARGKWLQERTDQKLAGEALALLKRAATPEEVVGALGRKVAREATPNIVPPGAMVLQPSDERRRSGSHYTPRSLTAPIVRETLRPVLEALGPRPAPEQVLELKVCDPAMGSGAFLVEACRQLGDALVHAWHAHDRVPAIPPDEDEVLFARRMVAQRCLYGVDRNPLAADLAKLSLWLVTLAREHAFTFLDHALRHGDSLVGLSRRQIEGLHWSPSPQLDLAERLVRERVERARALRDGIERAGDETPEQMLRDMLADADGALADVRMLGDVAVGAFFDGDNAKRRKEKREAAVAEVRTWLDDGSGFSRLHGRAAELREREPAIEPFHWEIEFPEVFTRVNPGFDAMVGNPPFAGRTTIANANVDGYIEWLQNLHADSHGNADLVAHFFRRAFALVRNSGAFGLIATNTIAQGDTRTTGLRWLCEHGGEIYNARKRVKWPGLAAVIVSVIHVMKGAYAGTKCLDERAVMMITAYLYHRGGHDDPARLKTNEGKSFQGCVVVGLGFTFDDTDTTGAATPIAEIQQYLEKNPRSREVILPYLGGEEVNASPIQAPHRFVINFGNRSEAECRRDWPDLMALVERKVRPDRESSLAKAWSKDKEKRAKNWWQFSRTAKDLYSTISGLDRVLVVPMVATHLSFVFQPADIVFSHKLCVFSLFTSASFSILQSRTHEVWARSLGSTLKDDLLYTPSDCFETFPFPREVESNAALEEVGKTYHEFRADLMMRNNEGLTATYNRFHDPDERSPDILKLRELHAAMDRAVLDAYGWTDLQPTCEFLLDYEEEEDDEGAPRRRKKPWRYRWPDDLRDEVLARLLELNRVRAQEERLSGAAAERGKRGGKKPKTGDDDQLAAF